MGNGDVGTDDGIGAGTNIQVGGVWVWVKLEVEGSGRIVVGC